MASRGLSQPALLVSSTYCQPSTELERQPIIATAIGEGDCCRRPVSLKWKLNQTFDPFEVNQTFTNASCERTCRRTNGCLHFSVSAKKKECVVCSGCLLVTNRASFRSFSLERARPVPTACQVTQTINRWAASFKADTEGTNRAALDAFRARAQQLHGFGHSVLPTARVPETSPVLYLFSGMDITTAHSFFPRAAEFVLLAEWEPGELICFEYPDCAKAATKSAKSMIEALAANPNYQSSRFQKSTFQTQVSSRDPNGQPRPGTRPIGVLPSMVGMLALAGHRFATAERLKPPLYGIALTTSEGTRFVYVSTWISSNTTRALEQLDEVREGFVDKRPFTAMFKAGTHTILRRDWVAEWILRHGVGTLHDETGLVVDAYASSCTAGAGEWTVKLHGSANSSVQVYNKLINQASKIAVNYEAAHKLARVQTSQAALGSTRVKGVEYGRRLAESEEPCFDNGMGCAHELQRDRDSMLALARRHSSKPLPFRIGYHNGSSALFAGWRTVGTCPQSNLPVRNWDSQR